MISLNGKYYIICIYISSKYVYKYQLYINVYIKKKNKNQLNSVKKKKIIEEEEERCLITNKKERTSCTQKEVN